MEKAPLLGEYTHSKQTFPDLDAVFQQFQKKEFLNLVDRKRSDKVNRALLKLIQKESIPCFLFSAVLDFVERIEKEKVLEHYTFTSFELWLNHFSSLSFEENYEVRAKIAGKWVDRSDYQALFPIGMGKVYEGTHFVTAHKSPDLDTTVASFWGWLDAFAARVGDSLHIWNLPGGPPASQIEVQWLFIDLFGQAVFTHLAKTRSALTLTGNDLMTQKGFHKKVPSDPITSVDHERGHTAVVIVDEEGYYLGDWRGLDVEGVRQVIILLSSSLRWFENNLHLQLISLLAKKELTFDTVSPFLKTLFTLKIEECEPVEEFSAKQKKQVNDFIVKILKIHEGIKCSFEALGLQLAQLAEVPFQGTDEMLGAMKELFDQQGALFEDRPKIFAFLEKAVSHLHKAILKIRSRLERLDVALNTKKGVFGRTLNYVTVRSDVEEIRNKMSSYPYLTVTYPDKGKLFPVGIIPATSLRKEILGTVSLRDFCNRNEMTIPSYLDVISVIDHHKSQLQTFSPPMAIIADAQSSNSLVAERAFQINDKYSLGGQTTEEIEKQIQQYSRENSPFSMRLLQTLLRRRLVAMQGREFFIHPDREFIEYLHFLYGIIDDTDLLSKVSSFDVECVTSLLNRLKSLFLKKEVEVVSLDDLPRDKEFAKKAAMRILRNKDMYSLYKKAYAFREKEIERNLVHCANGEPTNIFADTKEQNGCCRVGQTKMFANNIALFEKHIDAIRKSWFEIAEEVWQKKPEIDLHLHMISTIVSADEVYKGISDTYPHKDELWIWAPSTEIAIEHLKRFLNAFQSSPGLKDNSLEVEFLGDNAEELSMIFRESFLRISHKTKKKGLPIAVLRFRAGSVNSRKAMVTPFLPILIS